MPTYGKLNLLLINNILVFFSRNTKKTHTDQIILQIFLLCLKRKKRLTRQLQKSFSQVYVTDTACFKECFLFHMILERNYFLYKFIIAQKYFTTAMLLRSLKQAFWKKSVFNVCYLHNNIRLLLIPKIQTKASTS